MMGGAALLSATPPFQNHLPVTFLELPRTRNSVRGQTVRAAW